VRALSGKIAPKISPPAKLDNTLAASQPLKVLLCDDNALNQKVALRLLQQMGYQADVATTGFEALAALDRQPYDLVFMDVMMPEMTGIEATREIRKRQANPREHPGYQGRIAIVAMTASAMHGDKDACLEAGMDDYLSKPVRLDDFRAMVAKWGSTPAPSLKNNGEAKPGETSPSVDLRRLEEVSSGDKVVFREIASLFLREAAAQIASMQDALNVRDARELRRLAHSTAGASATCGANTLRRLLRELETDGARSELAHAPTLLEKIAAEFDQVRKELEPLLAEAAETVPV
jgi:CheY-like chemotaxis protein